jgi:hypothetical protein
VLPANEQTTAELTRKGELRLNITIDHKDDIFRESKGDYWLMQMFCRTICLHNDVLESKEKTLSLTFSLHELRTKVIQRLEHNYLEPVKQFVVASGSEPLTIHI